MKRSNAVTREVLKTGGSVIAAGRTAGAAGAIAASLVGTLGIAIEAMGILGEKRANELFDNDTLIQSVIIKIQKSDDFASYLLSLWQKYNLESSSDRRNF